MEAVWQHNHKLEPGLKSKNRWTNAVVHKLSGPEYGVPRPRKLSFQTFILCSPTHVLFWAQVEVLKHLVSLYLHLVQVADLTNTKQNVHPVMNPNFSQNRKFLLSMLMVMITVTLIVGFFASN